MSNTAFSVGIGESRFTFRSACNFFLFLRANLASVAIATIVVVLFVNRAHPLDQKIVMGGILIVTTLALIAFFDERRRIKNGILRDHLNEWGDIIAFCAYPRPGTSLLRVLEDRAGIRPSEIEEIKLQTCSFDNPYLKKLSEFLTKAGVNSDAEVSIIGVGESTQEETLKQYFPKAQVYRSREKLTKHFNLIRARGQYYLWYEPDHDDVSSKRYIPSEGAFLVSVRDPDSALKRFNSDIDPNFIELLGNRINEVSGAIK